MRRLSITHPSSLHAALAASLSLAFLSLTIAATPASAQTVIPAPPAEGRIYCPLPEDGTWVYKDAEPKELTRLEIETRCENNQVYARIRAFTSCIPRDCKWGWTKAELRDGGGLRVLLIGFLSAKLIEVRAFGDMLDAYVTDMVHDRSVPDRSKAYNLRRK